MIALPLLAGALVPACFSNSSSGTSTDAGFTNPDVTMTDSGEPGDTSAPDSMPADTAPPDAPADVAAMDAREGASATDSGDAGINDSSVADVATGDGGPQPLRNVVAIAGPGQSASTSNTAFCAVVSDGSARCWGSDGYGQTGTGTPTSPFVTAYATQPMGLSSGVTAIAVGDDHVCALQSGSTLCWGDNSYGQLGNGTSGFATSVYVPTVVPALAGASAVAAGEGVACIIASGNVSCWGANVTGNVGNGTTTEQDAPQATGVAATKIAVAGHTCAITSAGGVNCWGRDDYGQAGRVSTQGCSVASTPCDPSPGLTSITSGATGIFVGAYHSCAIVSGAAQCWGDDRSGQLGDGTTNVGVNSTPVAVQGLAGTPLALALSWQTTCALIQGGTVQCWGDNTAGVLGVLDAGTGSLTPVTVLTGATAIAGGDNNMCALMSDTTVRCWGNNQQGELGMGSFDSSPHGPTTVMVP